MELFLSLPQEQAYVIRQKLLEALGAESTNSVRNKIGDAVAEIAREYSDSSEFCRPDPSLDDHSDIDPRLTLHRGTMAGNSWNPLPAQYLFRGWTTRDRIPNILYYTGYH